MKGHGHTLYVPKDTPHNLIRAAGGIMMRVGSSGQVDFACIYREARGDWTFPKGSLDEGETFEQAALREVLEETGHVCQIVRYVGTTEYVHRKERPKIVAYFLMRFDEGELKSSDEVDEKVWLSPEVVRHHLTWDRDKELFDLVLQLPEVLVRSS